MLRIGLGSMGLNMSLNLQNHLSKTGGLPLVFTNRTLSRGAPLEAIGGKSMATVGQVVQASDIIFSCLSNDEALTETINTAIASGPTEGKTFVDCSTVHPETTIRLAETVSNTKATYVAAPVFGASTAAAAGQLIFVTAGPASSKQKITPYMTGVMGRSIIDLGESQEKASLMKITGNIIVVGLMEVLSEAHVFAEKTGLGSEILEAMIRDMFGPVAASYSARITSGAYAPAPGEKAGFDVALAIKDTRHALACAEGVGVKLDVAEAASGHLQLAKETQGQRALDSSSMYGAIRVLSGLDFLSDVIKKRDTKS
ncbi:6-phosphogluconate dehydrogenase [Aspergillus steynii IBT 23096]|uniref:6-phosphogluconate dehydrogenase n=1 Tax=Aspergillus steynii IBT 23096 TaxID=1392250 RepID=A0A2I2GM09_9EURO|nr:6-phosphogluconate dehydrogenase [Aspergillus steynii IBT 23096]PLB53900.1 6-phosphogluconate dehydrogenase [Aspergillus steynii IBT 23096]